MKQMLMCFLASALFTLNVHAMKRGNGEDKNSSKRDCHHERSEAQEIGSINFSFDQITDAITVKKSLPFHKPAVNGQSDNGIYTAHYPMNKTILAIKIGSAIKSALKDFHSAKSSHDKICERSGNQATAEEIASKLSTAATKYEDELVKYETSENFISSTTSDVSDLHEKIKLMRNLAKNMRNHNYFDNPKTFNKTNFSFSSAVALSAPAGLVVTTGGAKDIGHFSKQVQNNGVPKADDFVFEGYMSELALAIPEETSEYLAVKPITAYDAEAKKLYVQLGINTSLTKDTFKRKPLNLSIVLDISGSMDGKDNTEKSRLTWAKEVIDMAVAQMNEKDLLSIVLFDDKMDVLREPQTVHNKDAIKALYKGLHTRGSTNVYLGLKQGFDFVSKNSSKDYENRVILISDAGNNCGHNIEDIARLVTDHAAENPSIGLTAIGMGENFEQKLVHTITRSKGGNYSFVNSGKEMINFFTEFNFLVSAVAYNFKANVMLNRNSKAKLVDTFGIPKKDGEELGDIINVRTLFFAGKGGGAMVLEYDLNQ